MDAETIVSGLTPFLQRRTGAESVVISNVHAMTGGASRETWVLDAAIAKPGGEPETLRLVLRTDPPGGNLAAARSAEFTLLRAAYDHGVPVPRPYFMDEESLGAPFILMERIEGEAIGRRLIKDERYAGARKVMTGQLGRILAGIHAIDVEATGLTQVLPCPPPGESPARAEVARYRRTYETITPDPHPVFELAFRWLEMHLPESPDRRLVHGDYRIGNVMFGEEGVRAILDWELAHIGDPMEDLGWICVRSWRFGSDRLPVGGIGRREELFEAYEAAGGMKVDPERVRFWEVFGNLRWGVITLSQVRTFLDGRSPSVELAAIGRRTAETEWELLNLLEGA